MRTYRTDAIPAADDMRALRETEIGETFSR